MDLPDETPEPEDEIDAILLSIDRIEQILQGEVDYQLKLIGYRQMLMEEELLHTREALFDLAKAVRPEIHDLIRAQWEANRRAMLDRLLILVEDRDPGIAAALSREFDPDLPE